MNLTSQLVQDFWHDLLQRYGGRVVSKQDSHEMQLVAQFLDTIGVVDRDVFMQRFTTTLFDRIYIPFDLGVEGNGWTLWDQVVVAAHEVVHVQQFHDAPATFVLGYLFNRSDRATYEAQAYGANLELWRWCNGHVDVNALASSLGSYGLTADHVAYAAAYLATLDDVLRQGGTVAPTAHWTIEWLTAHGVRP